MEKKPQILLTNDDGISAPGLKSLWETLSEVGELLIIAPDKEQSGVGSAITIHNPIQIFPVEWDNATPAWKVSGTPADCIRMGLSVICKTPPDLILSGINKGANSGRNVLYSGTVGGVIEGTLRGVPGIAFSCCSFTNPDYHATQRWIHSIVSYILKHPLPLGTFLNVNFPEKLPIRGLKFARQGRGYWIENPEERFHPAGHSYYWLGGRWKDHQETIESDVHLLEEGYAAAVPIHVGELTDLSCFHTKKCDFDSHFECHD